MVHAFAMVRARAGRFARRLGLAAALTSLAAGGAAAAQSTAVPPPGAGQTVAAHTEYRLGFGDVLEVKFYYNPDLNEEVPIRPDGRISLQLVGDVQAAGRTPEELAAKLETLYGTTLRQPEVAVIVKQLAARHVYVGGEVNRPGVLPLGASLSAIQGIFEAGGPRRSARLTNVVVLRYQGTPKPQFMTVDLKAALKGGSGDVPLRPFDIVFVPKTRVARLDDFMDQYFRQVMPIPFALGVSYLWGAPFQ